MGACTSCIRGKHHKPRRPWVPGSTTPRGSPTTSYEEFSEESEDGHSPDDDKRVIESPWTEVARRNERRRSKHERRMQKYAAVEEIPTLAMSQSAHVMFVADADEVRVSDRRPPTPPHLALSGNNEKMRWDVDCDEEYIQEETDDNVSGHLLHQPTQPYIERNPTVGVVVKTSPTAAQGVTDTTNDDTLFSPSEFPSLAMPEVISTYRQPESHPNVPDDNPNELREDILSSGNSKGGSLLPQTGKSSNNVSTASIGETSLQARNASEGNNTSLMQNKLVPHSRENSSLQTTPDSRQLVYLPLTEEEKHGNARGVRKHRIFE